MKDITMNKYIIDVGGSKFVRYAEDAYSAIRKLLSQYGWTKGSYLVDASTRGLNCCEMHTSHGFAVSVKA